MRPYFMKNKLKREGREFSLLLKSVPAMLTVLFVTAVFVMNLLANKSIALPVPWLALDCGIIVSWAAFLMMDLLTKRFGPKAATEISVLATLVNLAFCLILFIGSKIPGIWSAQPETGGEPVADALNRTFGGTWYVVLGSTVAFLASAIVNNFLNFGIGKLFHKKPDGFGAFVMRSYVSTAIGQFVDNFVFALVVSHFFFGWTIVQCATCAATGMLAELLLEAAFSYPGFLILKQWEKKGVGEEYLAFCRQEEEVYEGAHHGNE